MVANAWGEKRSKPMNTLNWEKLPTFKAGRTIWAQGGATQSLEALLGGKSLDLDLTALEEMFAKPETKAVASGGAGASDEKKGASNRVTLLDAKRSTSVGIVMKAITDALQGKELRDALMEIDENLLPIEVLPKVVEIVPSAEERKLLLDYAGDVRSLDKPEAMLRTLAHIPRLEGRLKAMMFKAQLEADMDGMLMQRVDELKSACEEVKASKELHALMQIVLDVGNALNAGTSKGNAVGFKLSTLLKLAELKAADKKTTLLHYVVEVVRKNAPDIAKVVGLHKAVRDAARVSLDELKLKKAEAEKDLQLVDTEITWHDEQRLKDDPYGAGGGGGGAGDDDQFPEVFTEFYNWASERKDLDEELDAAGKAFEEACALLGEPDAKEPQELFDTLGKFIVRFEIAHREVDELERAKVEELKSSRLKKKEPSRSARRCCRRCPRSASAASATRAMRGRPPSRRELRRTTRVAMRPAVVGPAARTRAVGPWRGSRSGACPTAAATASTTGW